MRELPLLYNDNDGIIYSNGFQDLFWIPGGVHETKLGSLLAVMVKEEEGSSHHRSF